MEDYIKEKYLKMNQVDLVNFKHKLEDFMKDIGKTVFLMDLVKSLMKMEILMKVYLFLERDLDKENIKAVITNILVIGLMVK